ncbi:PREDICTED: probable salivary secreted peptide [Dufourea novaeangliae]|uniref:Putative salivary secreted peptide n=1 Tax=Dufourea novaeangliae TaxID=178035 RepID=A0A154P6H6_DUFNO|nr:PREDICTED: probable salivary secreted peptide [Dufourea novaeangliae]KZC07535.1 putative salivary secreted peptide [Dufourea novaeangliae]
MSAQKVAVFLAIAFIAVITTEVNSSAYYKAANNSGNLSHHLSVGTRLPGDRLVLRQNVIKTSSWMQVVIEEKTFNTTRYERITLVKALDQKTNGNGAYASLTAGGPGNTNVSIRFKSQRGHGINFVVELYAR